MCSIWNTKVNRVPATFVYKTPDVNNIDIIYKTFDKYKH